MLSAVLFSGGLFVVFMDGARNGSVLGDTTLTSSAAVSGIVDQTVKADVVPPTLPGQPSALIATDQSSIRLQWTPSVDVWRDITYKVFRNGKSIATTRYANHVDTDIVSGTMYSYAVQAFDASGNASEKSLATSVTIPRVVENVSALSSVVVPDKNVSTVAVSSLESVSSVVPVSSEQVGAETKTTRVVSSVKSVGEIDSESSSVGIQQRTASNDVAAVLPQRRPERVEPAIPGKTLSLRDTDGDGLSDAEELRLGTNPLVADTDGDGFGDGEEVKKGFNPLKSAASDRGDKVVFESPKEKRISNTASEDKQLRVEKVERVRKEDGTAVTKFSGKGVPNSVLTLYVYSDPIVVTVKTDADGNWSYELDRDIEDGRHEVYIAVTDATGRISSQSSPIPFVKTAEAVSVGAASDLDREVRGNQSPIERAGTEFIFVGIVLTIMFLLAAFYFIGRRALVN